MTTTTTSGQSLITSPFSSKPTIIPQFLDNKFTGKCYKIEQVLYRDLNGGAKQHIWFNPDPRPHNHPWEWIECKVIRGWYKADEWLDDEYETFSINTLTLSFGETRRLYHSDYHQITEVEPGTVSIMSFGPVVGDGKQWGHLKKDETSGKWVHDSNTNQEGFIDALWHMNPHMIKNPSWVDPYKDVFPVQSVEELLKSVGL